MSVADQPKVTWSSSEGHLKVRTRSPQHSNRTIRGSSRTHPNNDLRVIWRSSELFFVSHPWIIRGSLEKGITRSSKSHPTVIRPSPASHLTIINTLSQNPWRKNEQVFLGFQWLGILAWWKKKGSHHLSSKRNHATLIRHVTKKSWMHQTALHWRLYHQSNRKMTRSGRQHCRAWSRSMRASK